MALTLDDVAAFLPRLVLAHHHGKPAPERASEQQFEAAVMLADVSGFTKLAERLAREGPAGAEALTRILNGYFGPLIERIHASGGDVVKFAGDALIVLWPAGAEVTLLSAAARAAACGLSLQQWSTEGQPQGPDRLSLKVTVGVGAMRLAHLGGLKQRWELLVTGDGLASLAAITSHAKADQVLLTDAACALLDGAIEARRLKEGGAVLTRIDAPPRTPPEPRWSPSAEIVRGYLPDAVLSRLEAGQRGFLSESRQATVMFVNFPNATHATPLLRADAIMVLMQQIAERFEGTINKLSVDEKGVSMVGAFGLPPLAHEDDPARALKAALALQAELRKLEVHHAIGVTTGRVFCGVVGSDARHEYTVMGDTVNLAARLMQAAKDDLLCDAATATLAAAAVTFEEVPPLSVKGKSGKIAVRRPLAAREKERATSRGGLVGRDAERAAIVAVLDGLKQERRSATLVIEGEAGIGKSRLVAWLEEESRARGLVTRTGFGDAVERATAYHALRPVMGQAFGFAPGDGAAIKREKALTMLASDPEALRLAPLLDAVLPLGIEENEVTRQLTGELRGDNTRDLLLRLLGNLIRRAPVVLVLEDAHWIDSATLAVVQLAAERLTPLVVVLATRPQVPPLATSWRRLAESPAALTLRLAPLGGPESLELVKQRLGVRSLPAAVAALIQEKAGGHPYFSEELAFSLRDAGHLIVEDGDCRLAQESISLATLDLPDTVQGAITSRVDRLPQEQQLTLKVASVFGRLFPLEVLQEIFPIAAERPRLAAHLDALRELDLTLLDQQTPPTYFFKHAITQQVVYDQILLAQRTELHLAAACALERRHSLDPAAHAPLLAHHFGLGGDAGRTVRYLDLAGDAALSGGAYQEAIQFLEDAAARSRTISAASSTPLIQARRQRLLGEARLGLGQFEASRVALESAVALLGWPLPKGPRWAASLVSHLGAHLLQRTRPSKVIAAPEDRARFLEGARAFEKLGPVCFFQNDPLSTVFCSVTGANLAERAGPGDALARAYANLCVATSLIPFPAASRLYEQLALEWLAQSTHLPTLLWVNEILALVRTSRGALSAARANVSRGLELSIQLGDRRRHDECCMVLSQISLMQGDPTAAEALTTTMCEAARRRSDFHATAGALSTLGNVRVRRGRPAEAKALLDEALEFGTRVTALSEQIYAFGARSLMHLALGDRDAAQRDVRAALAITDRMMPTAVYVLEGYGAFAETAVRLHELSPSREGAALVKRALKALTTYSRPFQVAVPRLRYLQARVAAQAKQRGRALELFEESLVLASRFGLPFDEARAQLGLGELLVDGEDAARRLLSGAALLEKLGLRADPLGRAAPSSRVA